VLKGVVFNEMKGVFAENRSIYYERLLNSLLPSHTYGFISGGDPKDIPSLTLDALKEFHRTYYHPANSYIYSYGNFPLHEHLSYLNKTYLADVSSTGETILRTYRAVAREEGEQAKIAGEAELLHI